MGQEESKQSFGIERWGRDWRGWGYRGGGVEGVEEGQAGDREPKNSGRIFYLLVDRSGSKGNWKTVALV